MTWGGHANPNSNSVNPKCAEIVRVSHAPASSRFPYLWVLEILKI
jgi:hypothetical protein